MEKEEAVAMSGNGSTRAALDTVPRRCSATAVRRARGAQVSHAPEGVRHLAERHLDGVGARAREIGMGLLALGFEPGECASILSNTNIEWVFADLGVLGAAASSNGIYPTDAAAQVEYLCADSRTVYPVRRGRRAARQGARGARAAAERCGRSSSSTWTACASSRPAGDEPRRAARARARLRRRASRASGSARIAGCRSPRTWRSCLHLGHDRQAEGRDAFARQHRLTPSRGYNAIVAQDESDERMCFLPLCHIAERVGGEYYALYTGAC